MAAMTSLGVVLGGTGVRGFAQAGVLAALEREGLAPDVVVGVSTGAIVASAYAARWDWSEALQAVDRRRLPALPTVAGGAALARLMGTLRSARQLAPSVWTWGRQGYEAYGREVLEGLLGAELDFAATRVPLALVATDLASAGRAVIRDGEVLSATLAASALPGISRPVSRDGRTLVDGAFADPVPIDVARDLGADIVFVVVPSTTSEPIDVAEIDGPVAGLLRGVEIGHRAFLEERLAGADLALRADLGPEVRLLDFSGLDGAVRRASKAVGDSAEQLREALGRTRA